MVHTPPCSLTAEALHERVRAWRSLRSACLGSEETPAGAAVRYRLDPVVAQTLLELVEAEKACCPSIVFEVAVTLRIDAPEAIRPWVVSTLACEPTDASPERTDQAGRVNHEAVEEAVSAHYAAAARRVVLQEETVLDHAPVSIGARSYDPDALAGLAPQVLRSSIGCANPLAFADLRRGDVVLDLGSGGGMDVLLSARRVGPTGKAYGLDMTDDMLELARKNQAQAGIANAEFLRGRIEAIPLPDQSVDVVLSNCVLGLVPDKETALGEAYRVLRPGGRLALADVVAPAEATPAEKAVVDNWVSCLAGALTRSQYRAALEHAGFVDVSIDELERVTDRFESVMVRATKPTTG